jgi:hypothetical protein
MGASIAAEGVSITPNSPSREMLLFEREGWSCVCICVCITKGSTTMSSLREEKKENHTSEHDINISLKGGINCCR